jgi:ADP-ribosylglycohydrolase
MSLDLTSESFYDKVYGCWMGKNCGGTLGAPLEKGYGEPEPFDVWWYPKLQEGGIPNDDLEMQLIWLKALEDHGPALNARHMAEYWLDHIGYNWDEYGWARMNMRLGLIPPVAGHYNNWFIDCMGCPIRSEIFACVAPGLPRLAVKYAYEDAICDHAGGESVYGEMFNTAIESAAFLVSDLNELLDIGRSYVKEGSETAKAIDAARQAHKAGLDWKAARRKVLEATPHYNAQYSPINMGFQTVGLLYGKDFAETICIAVNCGYDTDCTGATVGSILGIIHGNKGLPAKWSEPLGESIATNESWGGLRNCDSGPNPIPRNLADLTKRTIAQAIRFSAGHTPRKEDLWADESIHKLWKLPVTRVSFPVGTFDVAVDYLDTPAVIPGSIKKLTTTIRNSSPDEQQVTATLNVPNDWEAAAPQTVAVPGLGEATLAWSVRIPSPARVNNSNLLSLRLTAPLRVAQAEAPIVLIGARRYRISKPFKLPGDPKETMDTVFPPESHTGKERPGLDTIYHAMGHDVALDKLVPPGHAIYLQTFLHADTERTIALGGPTSGGAMVWVNGKLENSYYQSERFRPAGHKSKSGADVVLKPGFNEVLVKFIRPADDQPFDAHVLLVEGPRNAGVVDIGWTRLPWDR